MCLTHTSEPPRSEDPRPLCTLLLSIPSTPAGSPVERPTCGPGLGDLASVVRLQVESRCLGNPSSILGGTGHPSTTETPRPGLRVWGRVLTVTEVIRRFTVQPGPPSRPPGPGWEQSQLHLGLWSSQPAGPYQGKACPGGGGRAQWTPPRPRGEPGCEWAGSGWRPSTRREGSPRLPLGVEPRV